MSDDILPPSMDQADRDSVSGIIKLVLTKHSQATDDMLPATVISYNRTNNRAQVQPLIYIVNTLNQRQERAPVVSVPALQLGGGGFLASWPINPGDIGWIKANDRDISLFKQNLAMTEPNTARLHSFEDALFIPDTMLKGVTIASEDANNLVIQNLAGTVKLAFWSTFMKIIGALGIGGNPGTSVILGLYSTTKAFKLPVMTTAQRNALSAEEGMMIYNSDGPGVNTYNGSMWG